MAKSTFQSAQLAKSAARESAVPIHRVDADGLAAVAAGLSARMRAWIETNHFTARPGTWLALPGDDGAVAGVLAAPPGGDGGPSDPLYAGKLARTLPEGLYCLGDGQDEPYEFVLGWGLGAYRFTRYAGKSKRRARLLVPREVASKQLERTLAATFLARDLINTPANDMGPEELEEAARHLAKTHKAQITSIRGDALLKKKLPLIHAVGRASDRPPRLIDLKWGNPKRPKVTLVGKGVCFDTGGLNLKPGNSMALMKKDMGGAANVLGLAAMVMAAKLPVRLRVLIPAVDNNVSASAYRPGDVLASRLGLTVEIGNTDAEGRLVLADALALADEEKPDLLIDMATLTGAARVALGPDLPPFYTDDDALADAIADHGAANADPLWRMPLWPAYDGWLDSKIADVNHITDTGLAGSITAALFLKRFVGNARSYVHFDIFGWCPREKPSSIVGGEAQGIRALYALLADRYHG